MGRVCRPRGPPGAVVVHDGQSGKLALFSRGSDNSSSRLAHAGSTRAFTNVAGHQALQFSLPHDLVRNGSAVGCHRQCLADPLGPVPTPENEASCDRFVRRSPLASYCTTTGYVERAMGLEPTTSSLGSTMNYMLTCSPALTRT